MKMTTELSGAGPHSIAGDVPASWLQRVVAAVIDLTIVGVITIGIIAASGAIFGSHDTSLIFNILVVDFVICIYFPLFMLRTNGETVGKRLLGIRVARTDGLPLGLRRAIWREVVIK